MAPPRLDTPSSLEDVVLSLNLHPGRSKVDGSASQVTLGELKEAGIKLLNKVDIDSEDDEAMVFSQQDSYCLRILRKLQGFRDIYFDVFSKSKKKDLIDFKIPVELVNNATAGVGDLKVNHYDTIISSTLNWIMESLDIGEHEYNPLHVATIQEPAPNTSDEQSLAVDVGDKQIANSNAGNVTHVEKVPRPSEGQAASPGKASRSAQRRTQAQNSLVYPQLRIDNLGSTQLMPDSKLDVDHVKHIMSWFHGLNLTAEPDGEGQHSEMTVQFIIGSPLRYMSQLPGCQVWSDLKLHYPDILKLGIGNKDDKDQEKSSANKVKTGIRKLNISKRSARADIDKQKPGTSSQNTQKKTTPSECRADIATRPAWHGPRKKGSSMTIADMLSRPVLIVGEAKSERTGVGKSMKDNKRSFAAQLAVAVHPSLVLLVLLHLRGKKLDSNTLNKFGELPEDFFIFGYYYDEKRVVIYAHFPYYHPKPSSDDPHPFGWRFAQARLAEFEFATYDETARLSKENARRRLQLSVAIQAVKEHGRRLHELFTSTQYAKIIETISALSEHTPH